MGCSWIVILPAPPPVSLFDEDAAVLFDTLPSSPRVGRSALAPTRSRAGPPRGRAGGLWTEEENQRLAALVAQQQAPDWPLIAVYFPDKSVHQVADRWGKVLNPALVKGNWTLDEDKQILDWVGANGTTSWTKLAATMPGRIGKQVRERYHNSLDPFVKKGEWSPTEDAIVTLLHQQWGNKWARIAEYLPGRTDNSIKNRWNATLKKHALQTMNIVPRDLPSSPVYRDESGLPDIFLS
jgi:hypothetical protein